VCVLYGGLGISKLQFLIKKYLKSFPAVNFLEIFGHQNPESGTGSGSALNQCGSTTLTGAFITQLTFSVRKFSYTKKRKFCGILTKVLY
jgi:hypothetical protein